MQSIGEFVGTPMDGKKVRLPAVAIAFGVAGSLLAGCASYTPKPIVPTNTAAALERRTLDEPRLSQFIAAASPTYVGGMRTWDISTLTLAALYYHPDVEISRNRLALARAGVITAGQVPNPNINIAPGSGILATVAPSPLTLGFDHVEGRIAFLRAELKITDAQAGAWDAFAAALRANAKALAAAREPMMSQMKMGQAGMGAGQPQAPMHVQSLAQRLDAQERWQTARLESTRAIKTAYTKLNDVLSPDQKKAADELLPPNMGMGIPMMKM